MIPVLVGLGVAAVGAAVLSDDDSKKNDAPVTSKRVVSESYVKQKMQKSGRGIKTVDNTKVGNLSTTLLKTSKIISEILHIDDRDVFFCSRLVEDLGANFNDRILIFNRLEREFNVEFGGLNIRTVGDIVNFINSK